MSVAMDLHHGADNKELRVLRSVCNGTFGKQLTVIQDQEESEAAVSVQTTGKIDPQTL